MESLLLLLHIFVHSLVIPPGVIIKLQIIAIPSLALENQQMRLRLCAARVLIVSNVNILTLPALTSLIKCYSSVETMQFLYNLGLISPYLSCLS